MTYGDPEARPPGLVTRRGRQQATHQACARGGDQRLRHGEHVLAGVERGDPRPCPARLRRPRRRRHRHQVAPPHAPRTQRKGVVPQGDHDRDRTQPAPARHRLRRPVSDPPTRPDHADRGDAGGAARPRQGGQGQVSGRLVDAGVGVRQGTAPSARARLGAVRVDAGPLQPAGPRGGARDAPAVRRRGRRHDRVEPAGQGQARARLDERPPPPGRRTTASPTCSTPQPKTATTRSSTRSAPSPMRAASRGRRSHSRGCGGTPSWRRRWSARAAPRRSTTRSPRSASTSPATRSGNSSSTTPRATTSRASPDDAEMQQIMARIPQFTTAS